jgi:hypothetical protein
MRFGRPPWHRKDKKGISMSLETLIKFLIAIALLVAILIFPAKIYESGKEVIAKVGSYFKLGGNTEDDKAKDFVDKVISNFNECNDAVESDCLCDFSYGITSSEYALYFSNQGIYLIDSKGKQVTKPETSKKLINVVKPCAYYMGGGAGCELSASTKYTYSGSGSPPICNSWNLDEFVLFYGGLAGQAPSLYFGPKDAYVSDGSSIKNTIKVSAEPKLVKKDGMVCFYTNWYASEHALTVAALPSCGQKPATYLAISKALLDDTKYTDQSVTVAQLNEIIDSAKTSKSTCMAAYIVEGEKNTGDKWYLLKTYMTNAGKETPVYLYFSSSSYKYQGGVGIITKTVSKDFEKVVLPSKTGRDVVYTGYALELKDINEVTKSVSFTKNTYCLDSNLLHTSCNSEATFDFSPIISKLSECPIVDVEPLRSKSGYVSG